MGFGVAVGFTVGFGVFVGFGVAVGFTVGFGVFVGLGVGLGVGFGVGFGVGLGVGLGVFVGLGVEYVPNSTKRLATYPFFSPYFTLYQSPPSPIIVSDSPK